MESDAGDGATGHLSGAADHHKRLAADGDTDREQLGSGIGISPRLWSPVFQGSDVF